jgi:hypothetical protein
MFRHCQKASESKLKQFSKVTGPFNLLAGPFAIELLTRQALAFGLAPILWTGGV